VDAKTNTNLTPLCRAIFFTKTEQVQEKLEVANYLIAHGANVNAKIGTHNGIPLFVAIQDAVNCTGFVVLLIKAGANVNIKDDNGNTPIYWAAMGNSKTLEVLIKAGANVNVKNNKGETPLDNARLFEESPSFIPDTIKNIQLLKAAGAKE
jgi:ankyrin repeat protein